MAESDRNAGSSPVAGSLLGVVDIGSNTVHLLVARSNGRSLVPVLDASEGLRLGSDVDNAGEISPSRLEELIGTLARYKEAAAQAGVTNVRLLATQAVRIAANREDVCEAVRKSLGLEVEVLAPTQEAALAFAGVNASCPSIGPRAMLDIGGGSAQVAVGENDRTWDSVSFALGAARMLASFVMGDPASAAEEALLGSYLSEVVPPALPLPGTAVTRLVGTGGTLRRTPGILGLEMGALFPHDWADRLLDILRGKTSADVASEYGITIERARLLLPAVLLLREVWEGYDCPPLLMSDYGLREGAILALARGASL